MSLWVVGGNEFVIGPGIQEGICITTESVRRIKRWEMGSTHSWGAT